MDQDKNIYNLRLSALGINPQPPLAAYDDSQVPAAHEDDNGLILNILPSYLMYQETISKHLTPTREEIRTQPPSYEVTPLATPQLTPQTSNASTDYFGGISLPTSPSGDAGPFNLGDAEENSTSWEDTLLANVHKLKRLTSINKELSKSLNIQIVLTKLVGQIGVKPTIIDPLKVELFQGSYIFGHILVENKTKQQIPFDMFSAVLEGSVTFGNNNSTLVQPPSRIVRFLTMFDFNASWNPAFLDRLATDHNNPHSYVDEIDPMDGTHVSFNREKVLEPGVTYKKFFTFRLPEKMLECTCDHGLVKHLQLPPTLGISKNEVITNLRQKWKDGGDVDLASPKPEDATRLQDRGKPRYASITNDFAFGDAAIDYSISARIIGRASDYQHLLVKSAVPHANPRGDEYVVANEDFCYLRVVGTMNNVFELNRSMINQEARLMYANMVNRIKETLSHGRELVQNPQPEMSSSSNALHPTASYTELAKMERKYTKTTKPHRSAENIYEVFLPYKKKSVFGSSKVIGLTAFSTPVTEYRVDYVPLLVFSHTGQVVPQTKIQVPIDISFIFSDKNGVILPDFKKVSVELISLTIKSKSLQIPVVFHPEMLFENKTRGSDNFDLTTIKTFQKYAVELSRLIKEVGPEALELDKELIQDVKCLANLATKYDHLKIAKTTIQAVGSTHEYLQLSSVPWELETISSSPEEEQIRYYKKLLLNIDIRDALTSASVPGEFCLVPDFQSCLIARLYYLKINLKSPNGDKLALRVPVVLQRQPVLH